MRGGKSVSKNYQNVPEDYLVCDSVTRLSPDAHGAVVIGGSHGGVYAAYLVARLGVAGVILNDAGVGKDNAGIGGLAYLDHFGIPAMTVGHGTARIGDGNDCANRGMITHVNKEAAACGVTVGIGAKEAAARLVEAGELRTQEVPAEREVRASLDLPDIVRPIHIMDSNSLVRNEDKGSVIVTGSHGGLLGGRPETAVKVDVFAALYNDAGVGIDGAGITRLPALDVRGIAAATVDGWSARIGDGRSCYETGVISYVNKTAERFGARTGMSAREFVTLMAVAGAK